MFYVQVKYPHTRRSKTFAFAHNVPAINFEESARAVGCKTSIRHDEAIALPNVDQDLMILESHRFES